MYRKDLTAYIAVISHKRPENITKMKELTGGCTFFVNKGEGKEYREAGLKNVVECGTNICEARNEAVKKAGKHYCIQLSDDLRSIKVASLSNGKVVKKNAEFGYVCRKLVTNLVTYRSKYGGVAVTDNALNYTGEDVSFDKLIVNDFICLAPGTFFDKNLYLKEDYGLAIEELISNRPVVRLNNILCNFPHRENKGGANTYRNEKSELEATQRLKKKLGQFLKDNPKRPGQVLLNYPAIRAHVKKIVFR